MCQGRMRRGDSRGAKDRSQPEPSPSTQMPREETTSSNSRMQSGDRLAGPASRQRTPHMAHERAVGQNMARHAAARIAAMRAAAAAAATGTALSGLRTSNTRPQRDVVRWKARGGPATPNTPFLRRMLGVAARRGDGPGMHAPALHERQPEHISITPAQTTTSSLAKRKADAILAALEPTSQSNERLDGLRVGKHKASDEPLSRAGPFHIP
jgi:hypothetical protein